MPYIRFHAFSENQVANISKDLKQELAAALNTAEESWEIEFISSSFFTKGIRTPTNPFVEVIWMTRPQGAQDLCAKVIAENLKRSTNQDIFILFRNVPKEAFYKNGTHF